jgi:hypothetical protein
VSFSKTQLAYVAGLFDGEGWISVARSGRTSKNIIRYTLQIGIANAYLPVLEEVRADFGGTINSQGKTNLQVYTWRAATDIAYDFMQAVRPYLRIKARQADLAIEYLEKVKRTKGRVTPEELEFREFYKRLIREARCGQ